MILCAIFIIFAILHISEFKRSFGVLVIISCILAYIHIVNLSNQRCFLMQIIFFLIVLDRIIYLCSFAIGKVIFYLFNLILFTYSVTEYAWHMGPSHQHAGGLALRAIFLAKAVSLTLQAIQIRCGIPHKSTLYRQFLTSEVSQINYLGYRLYRALPFLYELRCVLDWSCTSTSLTMYDWLKVSMIQFYGIAINLVCIFESSLGKLFNASPFL